MSEIKVEITDGELSESEIQELEAKLKASRQAKKARLVTVLERGQVGDRLHVPLPKEVYGEWVPNDKMEIYRKEALGFKIDTEYASSRALHDAGAGGQSVVADCVFMTIDKESKEIIDEIEREKFDKMNNPRGGMQKEERDFASLAAEAGLPIDNKSTSKIDSINLDRLKEALSSKD